MTLSPSAEKLRTTFINWTTKSNGRSVRRDYALYHSFFTTLPRPGDFWERLASCPLAVAFGPHYRFMAGVKHLLLEGGQHPIRDLYPEFHCQGQSCFKTSPGELFQDFCDLNWDRIINTALSRDVQINKVGRCALFLPLFAEAFERAGRRPLALIEVGASAGFGMLWPQLRYDFGSRGQVGVRDAQFVLNCRVRGGLTVRVPKTIPTVARQIGLELDPMDLSKEHDPHWLIALTAPNNLINQQQVRAAIALAQNVPPEIRRGCVMDTLEEAFSDLSSDTTCIIFHSLTIHHLEEQSKLLSYRRLLHSLSNSREFYEASVEWDSFKVGYGKPLPLRLRHWKNGRCASILLGLTDPAADGRWIFST